MKQRRNLVSKMESVQDCFNAKINVLVNIKETLKILYEEYEKERKSILSQAESMERSAGESRSRDLTETCKITTAILEELRIDIITNCESVKKEDISDQRKNEKKKCRYFNRGFCKYDLNCRFYHPDLVCNEYRQEGICRQRRCQQRHPRHCRYWTSNPEGCKRGDSCHY